MTKFSSTLMPLFECFVLFVVIVVVVVCSPSDATSSSTTTNTTATTTIDSDSDSDHDSKSKPWLSRMFTSGDKPGAADTAAAGGNLQQGANFNAAKHFDLKNIRHDFNRPPGNAAAPGVRVSKTGRKIR